MVWFINHDCPEVVSIPLAGDYIVGVRIKYYNHYN